MADEREIQSLWGQVFEIAVKRGVLLSLLASGVQRSERLALGRWPELGLIDVHRALAAALAQADPNQMALSRNTARHLFEMGMGLGQTAMREYVKTLCGSRRLPQDFRIETLWSPLQLPQAGGITKSDEERLQQEFQLAFGLTGGFDPGLAAKGHPLWADFLVLLEPVRGRAPRELLCLEFSLNGMTSALDYTEPDAHLDELARYKRFVDSRGVFSRVCAEVSGETFELSPDITEYLPAFTGRDKPLYKLCQAASYLDTTVTWLEGRGFATRPIRARALSITQNGFESLGARYFEEGTRDPRADLVRTLGQAYRMAERDVDDAEGELSEVVRGVYDRIRKSLPKRLRQQLRDLDMVVEPGTPVALDASEEISPFHNLIETMSQREVHDLVGGDSALCAHFGQEPRAAIDAALAQIGVPRSRVTLRDLHAAAVTAGLDRARLGDLTVLGLEGNPGIGKTTAVVNWLRAQSGGYLFLYASPRVIINDDVTDKLAKSPTDGRPTGALTITTNARFIGTARNWYREEGHLDPDLPAELDSAVGVDGIAGLPKFVDSTLLASPALREKLEETHTDANLRKRPETERQDRMYRVHTPGVLKVLARTTRAVLARRPDITQVALTTAIQAYRDRGTGSSTLAALSELFQSKVETVQGKREREAFSRRMQTIMVMVDELTGDGAGALFVHDIARWLTDQFLDPFEGAPVFKVILVVSDASLGNEVVLDRFLQSGRGAPDKVLVSPSQGNRPFRLALTSVKVGGRGHPTLHVMTNSYPAGKLTLDYHVRLDPVDLAIREDGQEESMRQAIAKQEDDALLHNAKREIISALEQKASQVIFFAQNKAFLRELQTSLTVGDDELGDALLRDSQVAVLDSSIPPFQRKELIAEERRDQVKVFLMTSSGARGISFPKTDWIIAIMPRFNVESALMEVAQLIYRGRGATYRADDGSEGHDGDSKDRHLVMLLQDYITMAPSEEVDPRQWLRRVSDLLTFLVLLRATIYTRITGDAGLDKRPLAIVPVGGIRSDPMLSLMSTQLRTFLQECAVLTRDKRQQSNTKGLIVRAAVAAEAVFAKTELVGSARQAVHWTTTRRQDLQRYSRYASGDNALLLPDLAAAADALLPAHVFCVGPFWLESWADLEAEERFRIEGMLTDVERDVAYLYGLFKAISRERALPQKLRRPAEELCRILARNKSDAAREFSAVKDVESPVVWLAVPGDHMRFFQERPDGRFPVLGDHEAWRDALACCLGVGSDFMPVIAKYQDIPFVAAFGVTDPARLDLVFDDRYLAASNELNLLNTILLAPAEEE